jgi:hypothetical protein
MLARTHFVACAEDDVIYTKEHFAYRPRTSNFAYNTSRWQLNPEHFFLRWSISMGMCIGTTRSMVLALSRRLAMSPRGRGGKKLWSEPGRKEEINRLPPMTYMEFQTTTPQIMVNHHNSLGYWRWPHDKDIVVTELPGVGKATDLWAALRCDTFEHGQ